MSSSPSTDYLAFGYAAVVAAGGIMGYVKKGSIMSGLMGLTFGGLMAFGAYQTSQNRNNVWLSMGVSGTLAGVMGKRFLSSGAVMPAGVVAALSLTMFARYAIHAVKSHNA